MNHLTVALQFYYKFTNRNSSVLSNSTDGEGCNASGGGGGGMNTTTSTTTSQQHDTTLIIAKLEGELLDKKKQLHSLQLSTSQAGAAGGRGDGVLELSASLV